MVLVRDGDQRLLAIDNPDALQGREGEHVVLIARVRRNHVRVISLVPQPRPAQGRRHRGSNVYLGYPACRVFSIATEALNDRRPEASGPPRETGAYAEPA